MAAKPSLFNPINQYDQDINDQFAFNDSEYGGSDELLGLDDFEDCRFAVSDEDENVTEHYYFLEANGAHLETDDDMILVEFEGIRFVLIEMNGRHAIVVNKISAQTAENLLSE